MSRLGGERQALQLRMLPSAQAKLCLRSRRGAEPPVPQPTARSGRGGGSCTAPLWPPCEVQLAPKPSRVPEGQCVLSPRLQEESVLPVLKEAFDCCQAIWVLPDTPQGSSVTPVLPHFPQTPHY